MHARAHKHMHADVYKCAHTSASIRSQCIHLLCLQKLACIFNQQSAAQAMGLDSASEEEGFAVFSIPSSKWMELFEAMYDMEFSGSVGRGGAEEQDGDRLALALQRAWLLTYLLTYTLILILAYTPVLNHLRIYTYRSNDSIVVQVAPDFKEPVTEPPLKRPCLSRAPADPETCRASAIGVSVETFRLLILMGFPIICFNLLHYITATVGPLSRTLDCIEYFSGVANIARVFRHNKGSCQEYDYIRCVENENLCRPAGWMTAFVFAMQLKERGLASWATVCSSWIFMCKNCTGRSRDRPWGAPPGPGITQSTEKGNLMAARMICVLMLLQARHCTWLLEQPESSVMEFLPEWSYLLMRVQRVRTVMGAFGHASRKGTTLLSCHDWHKALERDIPPGFVAKKAMTKKFIDKNGIDRCTGIAGDLKESQAYTIEYARAVYEAHRQWLQRDDVEFLSEDIEGATYVEAQIPHGGFEDVEANFGISSTKPFWA